MALTLSYSSKGSPGRAMLGALLSLRIIPGFSYNLLLVSCGDNGFKKRIDQVLAWRPGYIVSLLPHGSPCPLYSKLSCILWRTFFYLKHPKRPFAAGCGTVPDWNLRGKF
jgi:hypothetical protein